MLSSSTNQNPTFSAPSSNIDAYYVLLLYVSSGALTSAPDEVTILVKKSTSSVEDHASKADMRVYPNPNSGVFEIDLGLYGESCQLTIFNSIGAKIHQAIMNQTGKVFIDIKNHKRGVYFVNVKNDKINQTRQIVIR